VKQLICKLPHIAIIMKRRQLLKGLGSATAISVLPRVVPAQSTKMPKSAFKYCLNMATIRGHKLGFAKELEIASKAGFRSVEIWMDSLQTYLEGGSTSREVKKRLDDLGLVAENSIGFAPWIVDEADRRNKGLEQLKKEMQLLSEIGCKRVAAPPAGATEKAGLNLDLAAERYRAILELGVQTGVVPHLELWGFSKNLGKLSEVLYVAVESRHPSAKVLLDVYHLFKGGSGFETVSLVSRRGLDIIHLNDYSSAKTAAEITDADRIYPGDGIGPVKEILKTLTDPSQPLIISVEVFNKNYYAQDPLLVAKTALAKMKAITTSI
jgi:sugar phosphate isomerase/epimerase